MKKKLGLLSVLLCTSSFIFAQTTNTAKDFKEKNNTFTFTESQLGEDADVSQSVAAITSATDDVYLSNVGYSFSPMRFRVRGYDSQYNGVYINGILFNNTEIGRFSYGLIGGLNDATRNKEGIANFEQNGFSFGSIGGATNITMRASQYAAGNKLTLSATNRNYVARGIFTHSTGLLDNGWAFTGTIGFRWANEGQVDGTFYNAFSYFFSAEKKIDDRNSISISSFGAPTERGQQGASTQEAYDLAGSNYYNPYWGYQNGEKRNSRVVRSFEPTTIATWNFELDKKTKLVTSLAFKYSSYGTSAFGFGNNALDPRPDYTKKLPSYFTDAEKEAVTKAWETDEAYRQVNWDEIYRTNQQQNQFNETASYYLEERHNDQMTLALSSVLNKSFKSTHLTAGLEVNSTKGLHFKKMKDLLGATSFVDLDAFAIRDFGETSPMAQNDMDNPNRSIATGDKFGYNYNVYNNKARLFAQGKTVTRYFDFFYGANIGGTQMYRDGLMRNGRAPEGNASKGLSDKKFFTEYAVKGGATFKINRNHTFTLSGIYENRAPLSRNAFVAPRIKNLYVDGITTEKILNGNFDYNFTVGPVHGRIGAFYTKFTDVTELEAFYDDDSHKFTYLSMNNIDKQNYGFEAGVEVRINSSLSVTGLATYSDSQYKNNPTATLTYESSNEVVTGQTVYCKDFRQSGTPLSAYSLGIDYNKSGWFFSVNGNYYDDIYLDFSTIRRLSKTIIAEENRDPQEKLAGGFMLDASIGKYIRLSKGRSISINLSGNNLLNKTDQRTGGYEQNRIDGDKYQSKYFYARGINGYLNISYRF
ncbi:MAG: TonB-dependent receptor [Bacteroidaceae bacterium]|nr:TonB-dependent receptor [Bacteroidaceae bacterium]